MHHMKACYLLWLWMKLQLMIPSQCTVGPTASFFFFFFLFYTSSALISFPCVWLTCFSLGVHQHTPKSSSQNMRQYRNVFNDRARRDFCYWLVEKKGPTCKLWLMLWLQQNVTYTISISLVWHSHSHVAERSEIHILNVFLYCSAFKTGQYTIPILILILTLLSKTFLYQYGPVYTHFLQLAKQSLSITSSILFYIITSKNISLCIWWYWKPVIR